MSVPVALPLRSPSASRSARERWKVSSSEVGPDGLLGGAPLVARAISAARLLAGAERLVAVSIEDLEVVAAVRVGADLVLTVALEREHAGEVVVSVVIRQGEPGAQGGVAVVGVLRFAALSDGWSPTRGSSLLLQTARRGASRGLTPVEARFRVNGGLEGLSSEGLVGRVQETSLVSAQGFASGPVALEALHALSVLSGVYVGQQLLLRCSVVHADGGRVTVLSHLVDEGDQRDVLCALTSYRSTRQIRSVDGREWTGELVRFHLEGDGYGVIS